MDPLIEHQDLRPPPQPGPPGGLAVAILIHALLIAAVVWGIQWKRSASGESAEPQAEQTTVSAPPLAAPGVPARTQPSQPSAAGSEKTSAPAQGRLVCPVRPLLAAAGAKDGQLVPPPNVSGALDKDIDALGVAGKEAAAAGRVRDAEVAFLSSCRVADARKGASSIESANARYQLARHYVEVANAGTNLPAAQRAEMLGKAQAFYEESLQHFRTQLGATHEKTRFASEGLDAARVALRQGTGSGSGSSVTTAGMGAGPAAPAVVEERQIAAELPRAAAPMPDVGRNAKPLKAVAGSSSQRSGSAKPSFDCGKARSYAERTICSDAQLTQLDQDVSRLHARARLSATDPAAFRRQNDAEWRRRERTCRDRSCLVRWYNDRRQQLTFYLPVAERAR